MKLRWERKKRRHRQTKSADRVGTSSCGFQPPSSTHLMSRVFNSKISFLQTEFGGKDNPDQISSGERVRWGTFQVLASNCSSAKDKLCLPQQVTNVLDLSAKARMEHPDFIWTFARGVLLVKPGGRKHNLDLTKLGKGWYRLNSVATLSEARKVVGWATSYPDSVRSIWGCSFQLLAKYPSDQIIWHIQAKLGILLQSRRNRWSKYEQTKLSLEYSTSLNPKTSETCTANSVCWEWAKQSFVHSGFSFRRSAVEPGPIQSWPLRM